MTLRQRALELHLAALELAATERQPFFDRQCRGDPHLLAEIEALQRHYMTTRRLCFEPSTAVDAPGQPAEPEEPARPGTSHPFATLPVQAGPFLIEAEIGSGSMGVVYRAQQSPHKRWVALKLLRTGLETEVARCRFALEAEALGKLKHAGIAHLYQTGSLRLEGVDYPYLAMELVEGPRLRQWVAEQRPKLRTLLLVVIELCDAIESAHRQGVVHRDLKPDNILVEVGDLVEAGDAACRPRILDFGLAKLLGDAPNRREDRAGDVLGTLTYMSPEQAAGSPDVDGRADVYAMGAIAYEMLTGRPPLPLGGSSVAEAQHRIATESPVPPSRLCPGLARDLDLVLERALAKDPARRYATARDFANDLDAVLAHRPVTVRDSTPAYRFACFARRQKVFAASLVLTGVAVLGVAGSGLLAIDAYGAERDRLVTMSKFAVTQLIGPMHALVGTSKVREDALQGLLPPIERCTELRPDDFDSLSCYEQILRYLGDIKVDDGLWPEASVLRRQAEATSCRLLELRPQEPLLRAEWATAVVRIGDVELHTDNRIGAGICYESAHAVYQQLAVAHPEQGRHVDDLAWSCDRLAALAIDDHRFDQAESYLQDRERLLVRLRELRPDSTTNLAGERALLGLRAHLAEVRGDCEGHLAYVERCLESARERLRREANDTQAAIEFVSSAVDYLYRAGDAMPSATARELCRDASLELDRLRIQEPDHSLARDLEASMQVLCGRFP